MTNPSDETLSDEALDLDDENLDEDLDEDDDEDEDDEALDA